MCLAQCLMVLKKWNFLSLWSGIKGCGEPQHTKEHEILKLEAELRTVKKEIENSGVDSSEKGLPSQSTHSHWNGLAAYFSVSKSTSVFKCLNITHNRVW